MDASFSPGSTCRPKVGSKAWADSTARSQAWPGWPFPTICSSAKSWRDACAYLPAQVAGCVAGAVAANLMFARAAVSIFSTRSPCRRTSSPGWTRVSFRLTKSIPAYPSGAQTRSRRLGRGLIRLATRLDGDQVAITVADDGCGIPEQHRARVFEQFFTTREVGRGAGQGLAIAWALVARKHGGVLRFVTEVGRGTTFEVRLPAALHGRVEAGAAR